MGTLAVPLTASPAVSAVASPAASAVAFPAASAVASPAAVSAEEEAVPASPAAGAVAGSVVAAELDREGPGDGDAGYVALSRERDGSLRVERLEATSPAEAVSEVLGSSSGDLLAVARDRPVGILGGTLDPLRPLQWSLDRVAFEQSWAATDGAGVVVAVVDTGVDAAHQDLVGAVLPGWDAILDAPGGTVDPHGHGTHVAGIIAARTANGVGTAGTAPGARILPVRVLGADGWGSLFDVVKGIAWAVDNGAHVVNLSLGGISGESLYRTVMEYARQQGVVVVAAAGNEAQRGNPVVYPAADPDVVAVAATTSTGSRASFSSHGWWVELAAPGQSIAAPCPVPAPLCSAGYPPLPAGYTRLSGTSMAAPHVAAAAALLLSAHPHLSPAGVKALLQDTADDLGPPGADPEFGAGLVNPLVALRRLHTTPPPTPSGVTAAAGQRRVTVSWTAAPSFTLAGFRVYRDGARIATVGVAGRSFTDPGRSPGAVHTYAVRAFDTRGTEGAPGGPVQVEVPIEPAGGYWVVRSDGRVDAAGSAPVLGSTPALSAPVVAAAATQSGRGYWLAGADGAVFAFGDARFHGSMAGQGLNSPIVGMAATTTGAGYWLLGADGGVFSFGDAAFFGSTGAIRLNEPVVDMAPTPSGRGYWLVATDGGIFAFGDASFHGSTGAIRLNRPVTSFTPATGGGYWLVATDGGIFAFDVPFHGSLPGLAGARHLPDARRIRATAKGGGYYILGADGNVFAFGAALPHGSRPGAEAVDLILAP